MEAILHYNEVKDHEIDAFTTQAHIEHAKRSLEEETKPPQTSIFQTHSEAKLLALTNFTPNEILDLGRPDENFRSPKPNINENGSQKGKEKEKHRKIKRK